MTNQCSVVRNRAKMGKKVCENVDSKRELLYAFSTLVFTPLLYYFAVTSAISSATSGSSGSVSPGVSGSDPSSLSSFSSSPLGQNGGGDGGESSTEAGQNNEEKVGGAVGNETGFTGDPIIGFILEHKELPFETVFYITAFEFLKLLIVFTIFPGSHLFDQTPSLQVMWNLAGGGNAGGSGGLGASGPGSSGKASQGRLPFSKRDSAASKSPPLQIKIMELWKGFCNFTAGCVICHIFVVLLGAPIIEDCKVTFQFSVILTTLLLSPLCLAVQPSRLLQELMFISLWNTENEILNRTKWKFAATVFGAWAGAIVIPLDWDRPWQKWPIPCLSSTIFTFLVSNLVLTIHLICSIFRVYHKVYMISTESSKIKNF